MAVLILLRVTREPLNAILSNPTDVIAEGFTGMSPQQFVDFFCRAMKCSPTTEITRIEFAYDETDLPENNTGF